jgi:hypothetical protein
MMTPNQTIAKKRSDVASALDRLAEFDIIQRDTAGSMAQFVENIGPEDLGLLFILDDMMSQIRDWADYSERPECEFKVDDLVTFNGAGEPDGGVSGLRVTDVRLIECNSIPSYWRVTATDGRGGVYEGAARFWTKDSGRPDSKKGEHNATL